MNEWAGKLTVIFGPRFLDNEPNVLLRYGLARPEPTVTNLSPSCTSDDGNFWSTPATAHWAHGV